MKSISIYQMEDINGGMKCIYHGIIAGVAVIGLGLVGAALVGIFDGGNIAGCWNGTQN